MLLVFVFILNYIETSAESHLKKRYDVATQTQYRFASAFQSFENGKVFEAHDATNKLAIYGYSVAYFFIFPIGGCYVLFALLRRKSGEYQQFALALVIDYLVSLPFYIFMPVSERWAYPASRAILLSDRWSSHLIESFRPVSGLNNCFPSFHVSSIVVFILAAYIFRLRMRHTLMILGLSVILGTYVLGIHWIPDILAGAALGCISMAFARWTPMTSSPSVWQLNSGLYITSGEPPSASRVT